jgi:DNA primase
MAGRIPQAFIDDLLERTDLVELVQRYVPLKKSGSEFAACCPFHSEHTPSFYVSPQKQFYHCFGCGAHGTAVSFLMEYENLSFPEAIGQLAEWAGLEVPREPGSVETEPTAHLLDALEAATRFYIDQLKHSPAAVEYLKGRGIDGTTARDFAIGWAPAGADTLVRAMGARFDTETLIASGLAARRDDGSLRDRFRARILFPIRDRRGRVTGFGGRLIEPGEPKYLNSPESAVFHKSQTVYGLFEARRAETRLGELVVTEGYMDVVGLAQAGFRRSVACMGTALTRGHLDLLFRQVPRLVLCFDGDEAGRRAAWRAMETALPVIQGMREIRVLFLPEGDDPDSVVRREGLEGWQRRLSAGAVLSETFMRLLAERYPLDTAEGRSQCAHAAVALVDTVPDPLFRGQLCDLVAERTTPPAHGSRRCSGSLKPVHKLLPPLPGGPTPHPAALRPGGQTSCGPRCSRASCSCRRRTGATLASCAWWPRAAALRRSSAPSWTGSRPTPAFPRPPARTVPDASFFPRLMQLASLPLGVEEPELSRRVALDSADRLFREHCRERMRSLSSQADRPLEPEEIEELRRLQALLAQGEGAGNRGE